MNVKWTARGLLVLILLMGLLALSTMAMAKEVSQNWELINPEGMVAAIKPVEVAPHPTSLEGKTILLRWNGKPGGNMFLDHVAELLAKAVPTAKVIKLYEIEPGTGRYNTTIGEAAAEMSKAVKTYRPDIVIASQAD
jgi:hypothetical protein